MSRSPLATPGATLDVLRTHGLYTRKSLGQHFLVDGNIVTRILDLASLSSHDVVLEVGPGIGTLTVALCGEAGSVVAVERDARLLPVLDDTLGGCGNVTVVHADAVDVPVEQLATSLGPPVALVANLPYSVAATVVLRFFEELSTLRFAVVMVQAEVADRMTAAPGSKQYGSYTVKLGLHVEPGARFPVPRTCFLPPPRVDSAVVRLDRVERGAAHDAAWAAARMADAAFAQRRKTIRNSLVSALGAAPETVEAVLAEAGVDPTRRAETLALEEYLTLGEAAMKSTLLP